MQRLLQAQAGPGGSRPGTPGVAGGSLGSSTADDATVQARLTGRTDRLVSRVDAGAAQLTSRFVAMVQQLELQAEEDASGDRPSLPTATSANAALQVTGHSAALVRAVEELQRIVREVREAWVLGSSSEVDGRGSDTDHVSPKAEFDQAHGEQEIDAAQIARYIEATLDKV